MAGVYLHIPFCRQACNYCDFHFSTTLQEAARMTNVMCQEIGSRSSYLTNKTLSTLYFGGGTPSLLGISELESLFAALRSNFTWVPEAEITLEANPDDITREKLKAWLQLGINRLSMGLQSFNDEELAWMKRAHRSKDALRAVKMAQDAGFENMSIDLIYGSKFQRPGDWENTLKQAIDLNCPHISAYNLTIEQKTELGVKYRKGAEPPVDENLSRELFLLMRNILLSAGYAHYEISNFAKPGYTARHNSSYWKQEPYLGIGPSAHSYNGISRQWNFANNQRYMSSIEKGENFFEYENLSVRDLYNEFVMTRLRTCWGCSADEIANRFGRIFSDHFEKTALAKKGLIEAENRVYSLTENGMLQADALASDLFMQG